MAIRVAGTMMALFMLALFMMALFMIANAARQDSVSGSATSTSSHSRGSTCVPLTWLPFSQDRSFPVINATCACQSTVAAPICSASIFCNYSTSMADNTPCVVTKE